MDPTLLRPSSPSLPVAAAAAAAAAVAVAAATHHLPFHHHFALALLSCHECAQCPLPP